MMDLAVKVTALLGAAWVVAFLLRGRAASTRHAVWIGLMAAALVLPIFAALVPPVELAWLPAQATAISQPHQNSGGTFDAPPQDRVERSAPDAFSMQPTAAPIAAPRSALTVRQALLGGWFVVAMFLVLRLIAAHAQARRLLASCSAASDDLSSAVASVSAELGVNAPPVRVAHRGAMPAVIGILRPSIVLPVEAASWTAERLRVVLLHECAHVRRRDALLQLMTSVATAAYWWHPLSWLAARQIVRERELACDDLVIASGTSGATYAEHLLDIARSLRPSRQPALAMARPSELEGRLIALLEERPRDTRPARARALGIALALVAVAIVAPLTIVAKDAPASPGTIALQAQPDVLTSRVVVTGPEIEVPHAQTAAASTRPGTDGTVQAVPAPPLDNAMADTLLRAARDRDPDIRLVALAALNRSSSTKHVPLMLDLLKDESEDVRTLALLNLIHLERHEVLSHLPVALADESADVRRAAVMGISRMAHPDKAALLLKAASDSSDDVRTMAALGLSRVSGTQVDEMLVKLSSDVSAGVRRAAIIAIAGRTGGGLDLDARLGRPRKQ